MTAQPIPPATFVFQASVVCRMCKGKTGMYLVTFGVKWARPVRIALCRTCDDVWPSNLVE